MPQTTKKRQSSYRFGLFAESLVIGYLWLKSYRILKKRYKTKVGEIDIIAKKGRQIVFIEVKARHNKQDAYEVLSKHQQDRITRSASLFMARNQDFANYNIRFDLITVTSGFRLKHIENAWW